MKKTTTTLLLKQHFGLNLSRIKFLILIIGALLEQKSLCLYRLVLGIRSDAQTSSSYRRLQRFMAQVQLDKVELCRLLIRILGIEPSHQVVLMLDRTNYKKGQQDVNILYLCILYNGMSIPLVTQVLDPDKKGGSSNLQERKELLDVVLQILRPEQIVYLVGDREFGGHTWIGYLQTQSIGYSMRLNEAWQCTVQDYASKPLDKLLVKGVEGPQYLGKIRLGVGKPVQTEISGLWLPDGQPLIVAHHSGAHNPLQAYQARWAIEQHFYHAKTGGFQLEQCGLFQQRLETLLAIAALSQAFLAVQAADQAAKEPTLLSKKGQLRKSAFRLGLESIQKWLRKGLKGIHTLLNTLLARPPDLAHRLFVHSPPWFPKKYAFS